jgi:hypothetical protein
VDHQRRSEGEQEGPGRAVVDALAEQPETPVLRVEVDGVEKVTHVRMWRGIGRTHPQLASCTLAFVLSSTLLACGGGDEVAGTLPDPPPPPATAPTAPPQRAPAEAQTEPPPAGPAATVPPEEQEGGAGDEEGIRVPVELSYVPGGGLRPERVAVPAYLPLELSLAAVSGPPRTLLLEARGRRFEVRSGESTLVPGLQPGSYTLIIDGRPGSVLDVGAQPGP